MHTLGAALPSPLVVLLGTKHATFFAGAVRDPQTSLRDLAPAQPGTPEPCGLYQASGCSVALLVPGLTTGKCHALPPDILGAQ